MYSVYALVDPEDGVIFYVGFTKNVEQRYYYHCLLCDVLSNAYEWIKDLKERELKPDIYILEGEIDSRKDAYERETYWMNTFLDAGEPLVNYVAPCRRKVS